jgi:hypothetical protein
MENSPVVPEDAPGGSRKRERVMLILLLLFGIVWMVYWIWWDVPHGNFIGSVKEKSTEKMAVEIAGALSWFYSECDVLPIDSPGADWVGTTGEKNGLIAVLIGAEKPIGKLRNHNKINYLDDFKPAKKDDSGRMVDGIDALTHPLEPAIYDRWGQPFIVILDTNFDSVIASPLKSEGVLLIRGKKGIVYSTGPPNADGTRNTDESKFITSW